MTEPTKNKDEEPTEETPQEEEALSVPPSAQLPVEALLQLPAPTQPTAPSPQAALLELAATGQEMEEGPPVPPELAPHMGQIDGERLRAALQDARHTGQQFQQFTPRNLAKNTVGRGIDAALEAGGLRSPTRPMEPQ
jgi:hypothetical protein